MKSPLSFRPFSYSAVLLGLLAALATASSVRADVIYSNFPYDELGFGLVNSTYQYNAEAAKFNTGAFSGSLTSVEVALRVGNLGSAGSSAVNAFLFADTGTNAPASMIASLGTLSVFDSGSENYAEYSFSPTSSVLLTANTDYWVGFEKAVQDNNYILLAVTKNKTAMAGTNAYSDTNINGPWTGFSTALKTAIQVNGSAATTVPEASALALLAPGLLAVGAVIRRRKTA